MDARSPYLVKEMICVNLSHFAFLESFKRFLEADLSVANALWKEYLKKRWAQQRFRLFGGGKMRVVAKFFHNTLRIIL